MDVVMTEILSSGYGWLMNYVFYYPVIMSMVWMMGGIFFYWRRERGVPITPPVLDAYPLVSVLIPAHNEEQDIEDAVRSIFANDYPRLEVIVINDASTDGTQRVLDRLLGEFSALRIVHLRQNLGKAQGLNLALAMSHGDVLVTLDADSMLDRHAIEWAVWHFVKFPRVGAVTGNPRIRNRSTLLAKIQIAEYSSVIGLIKRTQRLLGKVMTVSGVVAAWRRTAVIHSGLWNPVSVTDDIEMTWRLETHFWDIRYEPNMLCWMLVPETIRGLWRQRLRWAQGGIEVLRLHSNIWHSWKERRSWPIYMDYIFSAFWALAFFFLLFVNGLHVLVNFLSGQDVLPQEVFGLFWGWNGMILASVSLLQILVSLLLDSHYDAGLWKIFFWAPWYPLFYWMFNSLASVCSLPKGFLRDLNTNATWSSPDRGLR